MTEFSFLVLSYIPLTVLIERLFIQLAFEFRGGTLGEIMDHKDICE